MTRTMKTLTPFEAFELEIWGLRSAFERNRTVPVLLDFAVRQRTLSLADAVEATLQIYRRYRDRYRKDAAVTSKISMLVPEIEAYSNGLRTDPKDARVLLPGTDGTEVVYVVDTDLFCVLDDGTVEYPWRRGAGDGGTAGTAGAAGTVGTEPAAAAPPIPDPATAWTTMVGRVATLGISVDFYGPGRTADRSGAFSVKVREGLPGLPPPTPLTPQNAWYEVRLHEGLTDTERLAVLGEILGYLFLGNAPQVWSGGGAWTNRDALVPEAPPTAHWWIAPESRTRTPDDGTARPLLTATSRSFTDLAARQAALAGMIGAARAGLVDHLPDTGALGSPGHVVKDMRWVPVLEAAVQIGELLDGTMSPPQAVPPSGRHSSGMDEA